MRFQLIKILRSSIVAAAIRDSFNLSLSFEIFQEENIAVIMNRNHFSIFVTCNLQIQLLPSQPIRDGQHKQNPVRWRG